MSDAHASTTTSNSRIATETLVDVGLIAGTGSFLALWAYCFTGWYAGLEPVRPLLSLMLLFGIVAAGCLAALARRDEFA